MLSTVTIREVGALAILAGLLTAAFSSGSAANVLILAVLLVLVGIGLRIEGALRAKPSNRPETTVPIDDGSQGQR